MALEAFEASSARAKVYSKLHSAAGTADLAAYAESLSVVEASSPSMEVNLHKRHLMSSIAASLARLGEVDVSRKFASAAAAIDAPPSLFILGTVPANAASLR